MSSRDCCAASPASAAGSGSGRRADASSSRDRRRRRSRTRRAIATTMSRWDTHSSRCGFAVWSRRSTAITMRRERRRMSANSERHAGNSRSHVATWQSSGSDWSQPDTPLSEESRAERRSPGPTGRVSESRGTGSSAESPWCADTASRPDGSWVRTFVSRRQNESDGDRSNERRNRFWGCRSGGR